MLQLTRWKRRHLDMIPPTQSNPADVTARPLMPLSGECLDPVRLGVVEGYVHDGGWASLQDWAGTGQRPASAVPSSRTDGSVHAPRRTTMAKVSVPYLQAGRAMGEMFIATPTSSPGFADKPANNTTLPRGAGPHGASVSPQNPTSVLAGQSRRSSAMLDLVVSVQHARLVDELQRPPAVSRRPGAQSAAGRVGDHVRTERYRGGR
jgi:hypothetical protein